MTIILNPSPLKKVNARASLRLGLSGGGTDVSPYCDLFGGSVVNATIDRYAYASIELINTQEIIFFSTDQNIKKKLLLHSLSDLNGILDLHQAVYIHMMNNYNNGNFLSLELITFCDAPAGSGLGASSTLVVVMIKAFAELLDLNLSQYDIAKLAFKIERLDCKLAGGRQDQYAAAFGGFNFIEFNKNDEVVVYPLDIKKELILELESSLILFFTGISRDSASIINNQIKNLEENSHSTLDAMHQIKNESIIMRKALLENDISLFISSMKSGWENKKLSAAAVSNPYIDQIYETAIKAGALAGKVSGAGGGGFMLFFVPIKQKFDLIKSLSKFNGQVSNCHFTRQSMQSWRQI
jgi:D-glycero-alpha-D-manno-heptose-7-phosphate kinase